MTIYIQGRPRNGSLIHAVPDDPKRRKQMGIGNMFYRSTALCGVRGLDAWGGGGFVLRPNFKSPDKFDTDKIDACRRCMSKLRRIR